MSKNSNVNACDLLKTNVTSMEMFRLTLSIARFKFLLKHIHLTDKHVRLERQKYDKLAPILEVFDTFNSNLSKYFFVSEFTTADEMLIAFRGKCGVRIYMSNKPNKVSLIDFD